MVNDLCDTIPAFPFFHSLDDPPALLEKALLLPANDALNKNASSNDLSVEL
jgi:hypothetical protein